MFFLPFVFIPQEILPTGYDYHVCTIDELPGPTFSFSGVIRVNIRDEDGAKQWVKDFEESSFCTWRVSKTFISTQRYVLFKVSQHLTFFAIKSNI